jgi:hypothetical protein
MACLPTCRAGIRALDVRMQCGQATWRGLTIDARSRDTAPSSEPGRVGRSQGCGPQAASADQGAPTSPNGVRRYAPATGNGAGLERSRLGERDQPVQYAERVGRARCRRVRPGDGLAANARAGRCRSRSACTGRGVGWMRPLAAAAATIPVVD